MDKTYRRGKFEVVVAEDGAIKVRRGDTLPKYALAIHGKIRRIGAFARRNRFGKLVRIDPSKPMLLANETVWHLPTHREYLTRSKQSAVMTFDQGSLIEVVSEKYTAPTIRYFAMQELHLPGEHAEWVATVYEIVHPADEALFFAEIAGFLGHGKLVVGAGWVVGIVHAILFPLMASIQFLNALETAERMYALRSVAYTATAWAFGETPPQESKTVLKNQMSWIQFPGHGKEALEKAWKQASAETLTLLEKQRAERAISKATFQGILRACGNNDKARLCLRLLQAYEEKISIYARDSWIAGYDTQYPD